MNHKNWTIWENCAKVLLSKLIPPSEHLKHLENFPIQEKHGFYKFLRFLAQTLTFNQVHFPNFKI